MMSVQTIDRAVHESREVIKLGMSSTKAINHTEYFFGCFAVFIRYKEPLRLHLNRLEIRER